MSTKTLDWYIPDKVRLQGYLEQLRACDNMIEVVEQVVKAMILDDNKRANAGTVYKSAFSRRCDLILASWKEALHTLHLTAVATR